MAEPEGKEYRQALFQHEVETSAAILEDGGLVLLPTDTLWSIGADGTDPVATERICNLRDNRSTASFELLVDSFQMLYAYCERLHPRLETLLVYHARPLTLKCTSLGKVPARLLDDSGNLAVRLVRDPFCQKLIQQFGKPLITAFAHAEGQDYASNFNAIQRRIIRSVDHVVRLPELESSGSPPVMVSLSEREELVFLRE